MSFGNPPIGETPETGKIFRIPGLLKVNSNNIATQKAGKEYKMLNKIEVRKFEALVSEEAILIPIGIAIKNEINIESRDKSKDQPILFLIIEMTGS